MQEQRKKKQEKKKHKQKQEIVPLGGFTNDDRKQCFPHL